MNQPPESKPRSSRRIAFISLMNGAPWGGSEIQWYQIALWLAARGHRVDVVMYRQDGNAKQRAELEKAGCILHLMSHEERSRTWLEKRQLKRVVDKVPFKKAELCFVNLGGWREQVHRPFSDLWKKLPKYVLMYHNYQVGEEVKERRLRSARDWAKHAVCNISDSARLFEVLEEQYGIDFPNKLALCNPITFDPPQAPPPARNVGDGDCLQLSVLAWLDTRRKGQDVLLKVLGADKWKERDWQLRLCGGGPDRVMLEDLVARLGLEGKVELPGQVAPKEELEATDVFLQMTHIDSMPISLVEAAAMGRPILASRVGDMPCWVEDDINGYLSEDASESEIDRVMERIWEARGRLKEFGAASFKKFEERYPNPYVESFLTQAGLSELLD